MYSPGGSYIVVAPVVTSWAVVGQQVKKNKNKKKYGKMHAKISNLVLTRTRKYDNINPVLTTLHWLPIKQIKILLITYKARNGLAPQYLSELLSHYSPPRPLLS